MKPKYLDTHSKLRSPLKLIGGKSKIREYLYSFKPKGVNNYVEVFLGSGTILMGKEADPSEIAADIQWNIINFFKSIQEDSDLLFRSIQDGLALIGEFQTEKEWFYYIKSFLTDQSCKGEVNIELATYFYLINKTCMNGIFRINSAGNCNSSFCGTTKGRGLVTKEWLEQIKERIQKVKFKNQDFITTIEEEDSEDSWIILDPPYLLLDKLHNPDGSTAIYNGKKFTLQDHENLRQLLIKSKSKWLLTINDCLWVRENYKEFNILDNPVFYSCSQTSKGRNIHNEFIIRNYD